MPEPTTQPAPPRRARQGLRISLAMLMLLIAALAVWIAQLTNRARRQAEVIEALEVKGGMIEFDYEYEPGADVTMLLKRKGARPLAPLWLRRVVGEDFFRKIIVVSLGPRALWMAPREFAPGSRAPRTEDDLMRRLIALGGLRFLSLRGPELTDQGLQNASELQDLEYLDIYSCSRLGDDGLAFLPSLRRLRSLGIGDCPITGRTVEHVAQLGTLETLVLDGPFLDDRGLARLRALTRLKSLTLISDQITDRGLANVAAFSRLERLHVTSLSVTDEALASVAKLTELRYLSLTGPFRDGGIDRLRPLQKLEWLSIYPTGLPLTDRALEALKQHRKLKSLTLGAPHEERTQFSDEALVELVNALPALMTLYLERQYQGHTALDGLQKARASLDIRYER